MLFNENTNILIISNEPWGDIWYSKHNYAFELSRKCKVFFVNPPGKWNPKNLFNSKIRHQQVGDHLFTLTYENALPHKLYHLNKRIVSRRIRKYLSKLKVYNPVLWSFDPYRLTKPELLHCSYAIFHIVDKYLLKYPGELELIESADVLITVSNELLEGAHQRKPVLTIPHGISSDEFYPNHAIIETLKDHLPENFGLYIGMIDRRIDYALLEKILQKFADIPFVFIGKDLGHHSKEYIRIFKEKKYQNLHFLGPKPFKELKNFIYLSSFCLAPMDINEPGNSISHHKIFQYLAMGKPVFSPEFSSYKNIAHLMYMSNEHQILINKLEEFTQSKEKNDIAQMRIAYAKSNTFDRHLESIEAFLKKNA